MVMVEIHENKFDEVVENLSKGLKYFDKSFKCLEEMKRHSGRNRHDDDEDEWEDEEYRHRDSRRERRSGRYGWSN